MTSTIPNGLTTNVYFGLMSLVNHCSNVCFLAYGSSKSNSPCLQQKDSCYGKNERMSQQKLTVSLRTECVSRLFTFCWPKQVIRSRQISMSMLCYRGNAPKSNRCEDREMAQHVEVLANLTTEPGTHVKS